VPPGDAGLEERLEVKPVRRGIGSGGSIDVRVLGPLGLAWRQGRLALPWSATVYPNLLAASLRALPLQAARAEAACNVRRPGEDGRSRPPGVGAGRHSIID
jgi:uncharacterized protein (DUF58 family)